MEQKQVGSRVASVLGDASASAMKVWQGCEFVESSDWQEE